MLYKFYQSRRIIRKFAVITSTAVEGNGCWKFSMKAKSRKLWKISKVHVWINMEFFKKTD